jgi:hypothetical protein
MVPQLLTASLQSPSCPCCGGELESKCLPAKVLCSTSVVATQIREHHCAACGFRTAYDGSEDFVLRKASFRSGALGSFELCLHWELLYSTIHELVEGRHWYSKWLSLLSSWKRAGCTAHHLAAFQSLYRHFREATMDFECLWNLQYTELLQCRCNPQFGTLVADGITVSCRQSGLRLSGPWLPRQPAPGEAPMEQVLGSAYENRFALPVPKIRAQLRVLSSAKGMEAVDYDELMQNCAEHNLQAFANAMDAIRVQPAPNPIMPEWARGFIRELGANSPACAIVRPAALELVQRWLVVVGDVLQGVSETARRQTAQAWAHEQVGAADRDIPVLAPAMRHLLLAAVVRSVASNHIEALTEQIRLLCEVRGRPVSLPVP